MFKITNFKLESYTNEIDTMRYLLSQDSFNKQLIISMLWLQTAEKPRTAEDSRKSSNTLRLIGNNILGSTEESENVTSNMHNVCRLFTHALFQAPHGSEERAMAHANRGSILQQLGYYKQAYDDNQCAREQGYPRDLLHKVILRQAHCSRYMGDVDRLRFHLDELRELQLNATFQKEVEELNECLQEPVAENERPENVSESEMPLHRETQEIVKGPAGRYMIAKAAINKNEIIFREPAVSFVPVRNSHICQNCACKLLVPFPCSKCKDQVIYCSVKCRNEHARTHSYECGGYLIKLFSKIGIGHLAFRIVIDELPKAINHLQTEKTANAIWAKLVLDEKKPDALGGYAATLQLISHMNRMALEDIKMYSLVSHLLTEYLSQFTSFFDLIKDTAASKADWMLVLASLILRHIGQCIINATTISAPTFISELKSENEFPLFSHIWKQPQHLKRGFLHVFAHFEEVASANFPYLSLCNHACAPSFQTKFSGRYVSTLAARNLEIGDEINNCYSMDWRQATRETRRSDLLKSYHFYCQCHKCSSKYPDVDFVKFHRYCCQNPDCCAVFVPNPIYWWNQEDDKFTPQKPMNCTVCGAAQPTEFLTKISDLLGDAHNNETRLALYEHFKDLDAVLIKHNELKQDLALKVVKTVFALHKDPLFGKQLNPNDLEALLYILKFFLSAVAAQSGANRIEYAIYMTFLWDIAAAGKYLFTVEENEVMLNATEILPAEFKTVFLNYYEDYIKPRLMD